MTDYPEIASVVTTDLCIACGACIEACPANVIVPSYSDYRGAHEIEILCADHCADCSRPCDRVCPSISVDFEKLGGTFQPADGPCTRVRRDDRVSVGFSLRHRRNGVSSSGGIVRAIIEDCVSRNVPVVCIADLGDHLGSDFKNRYAPLLVEEKEQWKNLPGSIYHGMSFTEALPILKSVDRPVAVVATPCQLEGMAKYLGECEPKLREKLYLIVGLICGWMYSDHAVLAFSTYKGMKQPVRDVRYRGDGKVGRLKIRSDGEIRSFDRTRFDSLREYVDFRACFSTELNRLRCRLCQNHLNLLADVSVGDAWLHRLGDEKSSLIVARTVKGRKVLNAMESEGKINTTQTDFEDLIESQGKSLVYGHQAKKFSSWLAKRGHLSPNYRFTKGDCTEVEMVSSDAIFLGEMWRRRVIRQGHYGLFRIIYVISRWRAVVSFAFQSVKKCCGKV